MPDKIVIRDEKTVLLEALGKRTKMGKHVIFKKRVGYEFPVADVPEGMAGDILRGEELTTESKDELDAQLAEAAEFNKGVDKYNAERPKGTPPRLPKTVPEKYHGHLVNFREAVPVKETVKKTTQPETQDVPGLSDLKWNDLRKLAREKGIDTLRKTREEIEAEVQALAEE